MFESLSERIGAALKKLSGRGVLRAGDVDAVLREVRLALLEADVNFKVVREFVERIRARLVGAEALPALTAAQQVVKVVHEELAQLLGGNQEGIRRASPPPAVLMLVGLQGAGKTTTAVKLALLGRREGLKPLVAALDQRRPAAAEQLRILAGREKVAFFEAPGAAEEVAAGAVTEARRQALDLVVLASSRSSRRRTVASCRATDARSATRPSLPSYPSRPCSARRIRSCTADREMRCRRAISARDQSCRRWRSRTFRWCPVSSAP